MPKEKAMAQISRPLQIALAAVVLLAGVSLFAFHRHSSSVSESSAPSATSAPSTTSSPTSRGSKATPTGGKAAGAPSKIYHGSAPGVQGLTRAIAKAHGAVAHSQQSAKQLEEKSAQVSSASTPGASSSPTSTSTHTTTSTASAPAAAASKSATQTAVKPHTAAHGGAPAQQVAVESELKHGKVVLVLFWNPKGVDDVAVRKELRAVNKKLGGKIAVHDALANQVGLFGSITRAIQVYQTPTILFVNRSGLTTTLTGFTDAFSIEQTIDEARQA
jgi:hypothetical protein